MIECTQFGLIDKLAVDLRNQTQIISNRKYQVRRIIAHSSLSREFGLKIKRTVFMQIFFLFTTYNYFTEYLPVIDWNFFLDSY